MKNAAIRLFAMLLLLGIAAPARACSVCGGDPDSDMVKGAFSGVIVMVAITYGLLSLFAGAGVMFIIRCRRLAAVGDPALHSGIPPAEDSSSHRLG